VLNIFVFILNTECISDFHTSFLLIFDEFCRFLQKKPAKNLQIKNTKKNMATVKLHLDKRTQKKDGTYPLKLAIILSISLLQSAK